MKKFMFLVLMIQSGFVFAQTKTVVTMYGEKVTINPYVNNGLTANNGYIQLGGALTQPSVLTTTSAFTLALKGLQTGAAADNLLVTDANGVLKTITKETLSNGFAKGSLLSTNATIAITGGTNKLFDGDAIIDIAPGASNTTLTTNSAGKVVWSASLPWILDGNNNGAVRSIGTNDNFDLPIETNSIERMRITSGGKVGIGTAAPTNNLEINGANGTATGLKLPTGASSGKVLTSDIDGNAVWQSGAIQLQTIVTAIGGSTIIPISAMQVPKLVNTFKNVLEDDAKKIYGAGYGWDATTCMYTVPRDGKYRVSMNIYVMGTGSVPSSLVGDNWRFYIIGSTVGTYPSMPFVSVTVTTGEQSVFTSGIITLKAGEKISVQAVNQIAARPVGIFSADGHTVLTIESL
ncbi:hypothetical protein [Flavobacterium johnsoniae]|uniref:hypothetical protein n=1 Tax=Flavobacterium johnsoniae TaxID=986 RepID=UPI003D97C8E2